MNSIEKKCKKHPELLRGKIKIVHKSVRAQEHKSIRLVHLCTCALFFLIFNLLILISGCKFHTDSEPMTDCYYLNPDKQLGTIGRVTLIELDNYSSYPHISADVTEALFLAIQKKQLFGLTHIRLNDPAWRSLQLDLDATYTLEQLLAIHKVLKCDAVLIGTITKYQPYPHMAIGLRMQLIDLKEGQLLWALEQVWDSADKNTESRIKNYFQRHMRTNSASLREQLVVVSSLKFLKFVSYEVAETLQPRR